MKKLIIVVMMIIGMMISKLNAQDSTYYFVSWLSLDKVETTSGYTTFCTAKNLVIKVPVTWSEQKVADTLRTKDDNWLYMTYLKEVSNIVYEDYLLLDTITAKEDQKKWLIEYVVLDAKNSIVGQYTTIKNLSGVFCPRKVEKYLESGFKQPIKKIVIMRFEVVI